jgi:type VI secretion system protein ImpF
MDLPREYVELHHSVFSFGVPDLTSLNAVDVEDRENIARVIEGIINRHEPRLRDVKVRLVHIEGQHLDRKVRYRVEARLNLDPAPEVAFDTILELSTGQYAIQSG